MFKKEQEKMLKLIKTASQLNISKNNRSLQVFEFGRDIPVKENEVMELPLTYELVIGGVKIQVGEEFASWYQGNLIKEDKELEKMIQPFIVKTRA